ncbi:serine/threonine protein kinase [Actinoplanes sp. NBRC 103695]|nr:serine/threonine protein kinase [Actinoplanes sp. NBRC 103695]
MLIAGRYRLHEPVGSGGMGRVWMARDEMLDRDVAVKEFVPPDWMTDDEKNRLRDRTLREARSAARLNHPHVVRIYDVVHAGGLPWIVMEYVPSRSLHQVIAEDGPYDPAAAARIGLDVLDALTAAHRAGVLHRDIKPHNVLIGDGRVVLTDFGLATFVDDGAVTGPGMVVGSPQYVSPERARDGASTVESDLWSLGASLYAAVEGRSPYARESAMATLMALATDSPDPPVLAGPLAPVLMGLLQRDPAARLTADQVEERLRAVVAGARTPEKARVTPNRARVPLPRSPAEVGNAAQPRLSGMLTDTPARPDVEPEPVVERNASPVTAGEPAAAPAARRGNRGPLAAEPRVKNAKRAPLAAAEHAPPPDTITVLPVGARRNRARFVVAGALLVAVLAGTGLAAGYLRQGDDDRARPVVVTPTGSAEPAASVTPAVAGFSPAICDREPAQDAPRTPQAGAKTDVNGWELVSGFSYFLDPAGFHIAVPDGWTYERIGTTVCFRDPENVRILSIDHGRNPTGDPVAACRTEATRLVRAGALPKYQQVGEIERVPLLNRAADWEYRYDNASAVRMHAITRWFASGPNAYALGWITRDFDWDQNRATYAMIQSSFYRQQPTGLRATPRR